MFSRGGGESRGEGRRLPSGFSRPGAVPGLEKMLVYKPNQASNGLFLCLFGLFFVSLADDEISGLLRLAGGVNQ